MSAHRNIAFRLIPGSIAKAEKISMTAGACRWVWNRVLADTQTEYRLYQDTMRFSEDTLIGMLFERPEKPSLTFFSLGKRFTALRRKVPWLQLLPYEPVRHVLKYQADAWKRAFADPNAGLPKFKARRGDDSFTIPQDVKIRTDSITGVRRLWVPKVGWCLLERSGGNPYEGCEVKQAVVHRVLGRWRCTVCYAVPEERVAPVDNGHTLGLDRNVGQVATSDGFILHTPKMAQLQGKENRYQRMMSRRKKGSKRRAKARHLRASASRKLAMVRADWQHHVSRALAQSAGTVVVEKLDVKMMTKSAKGTMKRPGSNVRAKARLNRGILATGWGGLKDKIEYKAANLIEVDPAYTSQACSHCGHVEEDNRRSQKRFECRACGRYGNADVNAALNILARGTGASGRRGAWALAPPMNRQQDMLKASVPAPAT